MAKPLDRRIQKTRKALLNALISLILEKGYDKVTIQDIIDRADVGRSTFYAHFENKEHLLLSGQRDFQKMTGLAADDAVDQVSGPSIDFLMFFEHILQNQKLARAMMLDRNDQFVGRFFRDIMASRIKDFLKRQRRLKGKLVNYHAEAGAAAMMSLVLTWLENGCQPAPAEMAQVARDLLLRMTGETP